MKWINHIAIAGAVTAAVNSALDGQITTGTTGTKK